VRLAYLGPRGTFCHEAAEAWLKGGGELHPQETIEQVIGAVARKEVDQGVVPVENSLEGSVGETLRMLSQEKNLLIQGELLLPVTHCLLAREQIPLSSLQRIYSHPQALGQCRQFLSSLDAVRLVPVESTAAAAALVASGKGREAAIAPARAARIYNLEVISEHLEDRRDNITRFIAVGWGTVPPSGRDKCSLLLALKDKPGSLYHLLEVFAKNNINMVRIESRPSRRHLGDYLFFIDLEGHLLDQGVAAAVDEARRRAAFCRHLGSYPAASLPE